MLSGLRNYSISRPVQRQAGFQSVNQPAFKAQRISYENNIKLVNHMRLNKFNGMGEHEFKASAATMEASKTADLTSDPGLLANVKIAVFSTQKYVEDFMVDPLNKICPNVHAVAVNLGPETAHYAKGHEVVNIFVNDDCGKEVIDQLVEGGTKLIALRCAGFDKVDIDYAYEKGLKVVRVPVYSPESVAEHAATLIMALNRNIHLVYQRVRVMNYALSGLVGFEMKHKTVGIYGTGAIGLAAAKIFHGFGCKLIAFDVQKNPAAEQLGVEYVSGDELFERSDIISLHCPLNKFTKHLINEDTINKMKRGVIIVNTSRGGLIDTPAVIKALEDGKFAGLGIDVYENESAIFFNDLSSYTGATGHPEYCWFRELEILKSFPNVIVTPHQAFLTKEALRNIANTTIENIAKFVNSGEVQNEVKPVPAK